MVEGRSYRSVLMNVVKPDSAKHTAVTSDYRFERLQRAVFLLLDRLNPAGRIGPAVELVVFNFGNFDHRGVNLVVISLRKLLIFHFR